MTTDKFMDMYWNSLKWVPSHLRKWLLNHGFYEREGTILYARTREISEIFTVEKLREYASMLNEFADWLEANKIKTE